MKNPPRVVYTGETHNVTRRKPPTLKHCAFEGCQKNTKGKDFCWKHKNKCSGCGKQISGNSTRCRECANQESKGARAKAISARFRLGGITTIPRDAIADLKDIIRCYEDAWLSGKWPTLCETTLPKLRAQLKAMLEQ